MWTKVTVVVVMLLALALVLYAWQSGLFSDVQNPWPPPR